ncbi:MAG: ABC transporter ATP-binding protein [bacterium]
MTFTQQTVGKGHLLEVRNLAVHFQMREPRRRILKAVDGISYSLRKGGSLGLVGESGSGKSVSALAVMGLLPAQGCTVTGEALLEGRNLAAMDQTALRGIRGREIGMIFQDPMSSLNPTIRIGEQVAEPLRWHGLMTARAADTRALELLELVGIPDPGKRFWEYPFQFSGGMRQRVMIAMALACNPKLLIADEPTTALDVTVQMQVLRLIARLRRERGTAVFLVSHDLGVVAEVCERIIVMYAGRIVESAPVSVFMREPAHPYSRKLLQSSPRLGRRMEPLDPIPGSPPDPLQLPSGCAFHPRCSSLMGICARETPPIFQCTADHASACWLHKGMPATP